MVRYLQTPYFVVHQSKLEQAILSAQNAVAQYWPNSIIGYSVKTNSMPWLLRYMRERGLYAEVVSDDEYLLAKHCGYTENTIIYNGIAKNKETFIEAIEKSALVHIDSWRELQWLKELNPERSYSVGLRVNFDLESMCPGETACGNEGGRFGFCIEDGEFERALSCLNVLPYVTLSSLHLHCSTKTRSLKVYQSIAKTACKIAKQYNLKLKFLDIGGGFFGGMTGKPQFADYLRVLQENLSQWFCPEETTIVIEPGISLVGAPISYVTTVVDVKKTTYHHFVITDGSRTHIDPLMHKSAYFYDIARRGTEAGSPMEEQVLCGFTCMETDRFMVWENLSPLCVGDEIRFCKVGAYTMNLASQFIRYFPAVYLEENGELREIQKKWSVTDVTRENREPEV